MTPAGPSRGNRKKEHRAGENHSQYFPAAFPCGFSAVRRKGMRCVNYTDIRNLECKSLDKTLVPAYKPQSISRQDAVKKESPYRDTSRP